MLKVVRKLILVVSLLLLTQCSNDSIVKNEKFTKDLVYSDLWQYIERQDCEFNAIVGKNATYEEVYKEGGWFLYSPTDPKLGGVLWLDAPDATLHELYEKSQHLDKDLWVKVKGVVKQVPLRYDAGHLRYDATHPQADPIAIFFKSNIIGTSFKAVTIHPSDDSLPQK